MPSDRPDVLVNLRCSAVVIVDGALLLLHRGEQPAHDAEGDWVLPGGRPQRGESLAACAQREVLEETGLRVTTGRCLFITEVSGTREERSVDLVFAADPVSRTVDPASHEPHLHPAFVPLTDLPHLTMRPPLAGHIRGLAHRRDIGATYLGDLWRPDRAGDPA